VGLLSRIWKGGPEALRREISEVHRRATEIKKQMDEMPTHTVTRGPWEHGDGKEYEEEVHGSEYWRLSAKYFRLVDRSYKLNEKLRRALAK
jgi:hypothetical protein